MQNFMGKDGFQWFVGVVEDRQDPKKVGRVRVRCLGYHSENVSDLPTDRLPWRQDEIEFVFILHHAPSILKNIDNCDNDTGLGPGVIAVDKHVCEPDATDLKLTESFCSRARVLKVKARREQVPLTIVTASTL